MKRLSLSVPLLLLVVLAIASLPRVFQTTAQEATPASPEASPASPASPAASGPVEAVLQDVTGAEVGSVAMSEANGQVTVTVTVMGMPPGDHGIHVHAMGMCDPSGEQPFTTAGPHYNPTGGMHGGPPAAEEAAMAGGDHSIHAGDFGNLTVAEDGSGTLEVATSRFTIAEGPTSLYDEDGSSFIVHASGDDLQSQPSGNSGGRIACAVLAPPAESMATPSTTAQTVDAAVLAPAQVPFTEDMLGQLQVPEGFEISVYAQGLDNPRMMAFGPDGTLYVTEPAGNSVLGLRDTDADGVADESFPAISNLRYVHGIVFHENRVYLAGEKQAWVADIAEDGTFANHQVILDNLPDGDQHGRRTIGVGPDGFLYISLGSSCNVCIETNPENATMIRSNLDGSGREIVAKGLRNTLGWAWHPETGELWGWDQGSDFRGDDQPPEELNLITGEANYGWPYCFGDQQADMYGPYQPQGATFEQYCANTQAPALEYQAHAAAIGFVFYTADAFPADYQGDGFVAMRGSWNRDPAVGYEVVHVQFEDGQPTAAEPFITGWLMPDGTSQFGRVAGLLVGPDGSLLIAEDSNGVIYRVSYTG